jgi:hypothetical protein
MLNSDMMYKGANATVAYSSNIAGTQKIYVLIKIAAATGVLVP